MKWPAYKLVAEGHAKLGDLRLMTWDEVIEANRILDAHAEAMHASKDGDG